MKKQVKFNGGFYDLFIDTNNNLQLNEIKSFETQYCRGYYCKSNKSTNQWKVELKKLYATKHYGTHVSYVKSKEDAIELINKIEHHLNSLYQLKSKITRKRTK